MNKLFALVVLIGLCDHILSKPATDQKKDKLVKRDYMAEARALLSKYPLIDGHNDLSYMIRENFLNQFDKFDLNNMTQYQTLGLLNGTSNTTHTDLIRLKNGQLGGQFWAVYADCKTNYKDAIRVHLEQIDTYKRLFKKYPGTFEQVKTAKEMSEAFNNKKIASVFGLESGHAIDSSLAILRIYYELGVRYMTLTHNCDTPWAGNNQLDRANTTNQFGLTSFGKTVIKEMNRLGMLVDLSHVSYKTMVDSLEVSEAPVIFSHSSVWNLCNHTRNVKDDVLRKLKQNGGVIMINFATQFITCSSQATVADVKRHITYVKNYIGVDYVGIGADYDGVTSVPVGLEDVGAYPNLIASLLEDGWTDEDVIKVAGGNILRALEQAEKKASELKASGLRPIDEIISQNDMAGKTSCRTSF